MSAKDHKDHKKAASHSHAHAGKSMVDEVTPDAIEESSEPASAKEPPAASPAPKPAPAAPAAVATEQRAKHPGQKTYPDDYDD